MLGTTGCGTQIKESGPPIATVILIGNHANSQYLDVQLESTIRQVYSSFGNIGIIVVDGDPTLIRDNNSTGILGCYNAEYLQNSKKQSINNDKMWIRNYITPQTQKIMKELSSCKADDPEVDMLQALHAAVESLNTMENSMGTNVEKEIIILDTGINTSGAMSFLIPEYRDLLTYGGRLWEDDMANSKTLELISHLESHAEIPKLNGIHVTWYGLGQASTPQQTLTKLEIQNLQFIWGELLSFAKACPSNMTNTDEKYGIFVSTNTYGTIESDQPVTPVPLNIPKTDITSIIPELQEQKVYFDKTSADYLSPEKSKEILKLYAVILQNYPHEKILLVGTTSSYNGGSIQLSEDRASTVKKTLMEYGIPESCIVTIGLSYNLKVCQNDSPNGHFEEPLAQENRSVLILQYDSPRAQDILAEKQNNDL